MEDRLDGNLHARPFGTGLDDLYNEEIDEPYDNPTTSDHLCFLYFLPVNLVYKIADRGFQELLVKT